jgi:hypothetical protein
MKSRDKMRNIIKPAVITIITILLFSACSSSSSTPDSEVIPLLEETINGYLSALQAEDVVDAVNYLTDVSLSSGLSFYFNTFDSWEFSNIEITVISQSGKKAGATVERDVAKTTGDETTVEHMFETVKLVKVDGKWLIESME